MKASFLAMTALLLSISPAVLADGANQQKSTQAKQMFLSDIKMPKDVKNIHVVKLGSDKNASDFVVFVRKNVPPHKHMTHTETVYVLEGTGIFELNGKKITIGPGHYVKIPEGAVHSVTVTSDIPLKALSIQAPEFFGKDRVKVTP